MHGNAEFGIGIAELLYKNGRRDAATRYFNLYSGTQATEALRLGQDLATGIEAQTKARFGIRRP